MDQSNQFNSGYYNQQNPGQPPMGGYNGLNGQQQQQSQQQPPSQSASTQQSPAQQEHPTLPPLQNGYSFGALSYPHVSGAPTPTSHTPTSSSLTNGAANAFSHVSPASAMGPPSTYSHYPMSQSMMYPSSTTTTLPPSVNGLPQIRPAPAAPPASLSSLPSLSTAHLGHQPSFLQNEEAPTHVVGSQGRRGILPSAPGRPNATTTPGGSIKNMMPQKDADGKFPCPHCNKTYLHAKHLKRHMLRHTGDRPYSCHLCKDTFSRSDILKRHFQKCSIRRGNPTGANHLAHQRRNNNRLSMQEGPIGLANLPEVTNTYNNGMSDHSPTITGDASTRTSRANSLISPAAMSHRNSLAGLGILGNNPAADPLSGQFAPAMHGYGLPSVSGAQMPSAYSFNQSAINGAYFNAPSAQPMPYLGHPNSRFDHSHTNSPHQQSPNGDTGHAHLDSGRLFSPNGQDGFMNGNMSQGILPPGDDNIKQEPESKHFPDQPNGGNNAGNNGNMGMPWQ